MAANLLIVDDSRSMRMVLRKILDMSGFKAGQYYEAGSGQEALEVLAQHHVDLVMTDINMPTMSGLELLSKIRASEQWGSTPVIIISTEGSQERREEAVRLGAAGYLQKPFQPEEVREVLNQSLGLSDES